MRGSGGDAGLAAGRGVAAGLAATAFFFGAGLGVGFRGGLARAFALTCFFLGFGAVFFDFAFATVILLGSHNRRFVLLNNRAGVNLKGSENIPVIFGVSAC